MSAEIHVLGWEMAPSVKYMSPRHADWNLAPSAHIKSSNVAYWGGEIRGSIGLAGLTGELWG